MCAARAPRSEGHLLTKVVMAQQFNLTEVLDAACHIMDSWDVATLRERYSVPSRESPVRMMQTTNNFQGDAAFYPELILSWDLR
jgi:hypothetical protein